MQYIKWGIIGCGDVTELKSGPAFKLAGSSSLVAVMRRDPIKSEDYAKRHGVPKWYSDADLLINDPDVNAIYVATPPSSHADYAIKAMEAGKPVYVEKPMALNFRECQRMIAVSERTGIQLHVAYYRRTLPGFLKVKELIEQGSIGEVRHINIELVKAPGNAERKGDLGWRVDPGISGGGHFFDLASHQLDYLDFLFGEMTLVHSEVKNLAGLYHAEDYVEADFSFNSGITCTGLWDFSGLGRGDNDLIIIEGERGTISFSTFGFLPVVLKNDSGISEFDFPKPGHVQIYLVESVVKALLGKGASPSTGISAARTSKIMDQVVSQYYG